MGATFARTVRENCTANQWATCIETAVGITDDPTMTEPTSIIGLSLSFDHQDHRTQLVNPRVKSVAMPSLHHEITGVTMQKPSSGLRWLIKFDAIKNVFAARLS